MRSGDSGKWSKESKGEASVSSASGQQAREPYSWRRVVEDREREQSGTDRISYPKKVIKEYKVAESIDAKESSKQPAAIGRQLWGMPTFHLGVSELDELRKLPEQSHMQSVSPNDAGEVSVDNKPPLIMNKKSYRDAIFSVRSRVPNDSGQKAIRKDVKEERLLSALESQEHRSGSASSRVRANFGEIEIDTIQPGNVKEYLDKLCTIKRSVEWNNTLPSTTDKGKEQSNEILKRYHMKIKEMQIKSQKMFKEYEIDMIKDVDIAKVKEFFSMLEKVDQSIYLSYDLEVSPEAKEEVERIKSLISSYDEISKGFCNSEFKSSPDGSIKEQSSLLGELLSKNEEDLNKYRKLEQESPKEAALQRLEYSYLKRQGEILNEARQALSNLRDNRGKEKSYLDAVSSGISNEQDKNGWDTIRMSTVVKWRLDKKTESKGKIGKRAEQFKILSQGPHGKQLCDDFKQIHEQNYRNHLTRLEHIFNELKEIRKKEEISEEENRIIEGYFQEISNMNIKSFDMFLKYEFNELDRRKDENRKNKNENRKNNKEVMKFFRLLDNIGKEIHYNADLEELSSGGKQWYKDLEPLHKMLMELYDMDKDKKIIEEEKFNSINRDIEERFTLYFKLCDSSPEKAAFYKSEYSHLKLIRKKLNDMKNKGLVKV